MLDFYLQSFNLMLAEFGLQSLRVAYEDNMTAPLSAGGNRTGDFSGRGVVSSHGIDSDFQ
jgi:hypothetical protein